MRLLQDVLRLSKETERIEWMDGWIDKQTDKSGDVWLELTQRIVQTKKPHPLIPENWEKRKSVM